jgi:hypothetical protein
MTQEEVSASLKGSREKSDAVIVMEFENGAQQVIRPTKAFRGSPKDLCDHIANGASYRIVS